MEHRVTVSMPDGDRPVPDGLTSAQADHFHKHLRSDFAARAVACCGPDDEAFDVVVAVGRSRQSSNDSADMLCCGWETAL